MSGPFLVVHPRGTCTINGVDHHITVLPITRNERGLCALHAASAESLERLTAGEDPDSI